MGVEIWGLNLHSQEQIDYCCDVFQGVCTAGGVHDNERAGERGRPEQAASEEGRHCWVSDGCVSCGLRRPKNKKMANKQSIDLKLSVLGFF
jgi:hypothetical protein